MSLISVIITTYNRRSYVKEAVLSVLSQDYPEKEIIVVDDGSTDGSADEVQGLPVTYIHKENGGISSARNVGIEASRGDYLAFLDVDDLWLKAKLSTQMKSMEIEGYEICYTGEIWIRNGKRSQPETKAQKAFGLDF